MPTDIRRRCRASAPGCLEVLFCPYSVVGRFHLEWVGNEVPNRRADAQALRWIMRIMNTDRAMTTSDISGAVIKLKT